MRPPCDDSRFRETVFGAGHGLLGFYVDEDALLIRIFDIVWVSRDGPSPHAFPDRLGASLDGSVPPDWQEHYASVRSASA